MSWDLANRDVALNLKTNRLVVNEAYTTSKSLGELKDPPLLALWQAALKV